MGLGMDPEGDRQARGVLVNDVGTDVWDLALMQQRGVVEGEFHLHLGQCMTWIEMGQTGDQEEQVRTGDQEEQVRTAVGSDGPHREMAQEGRA